MLTTCSVSFDVYTTQSKASIEGLNTLSTDDVDGPANIDAANAGGRMMPQFEPDIEHIIQEFEQKLFVQVCVCLMLL